ncbi:MAG: MalT-like region [Planctomycetota bacterium]
MRPVNRLPRVPSLCIAALVLGGSTQAETVSEGGGLQVAPTTPPNPPKTSPTAIPPGTTLPIGVEGFPDDPRLATALGMMRSGAFDAAVMTARTVIKSDPNVDRAQAILGIALNKQKQYAEAREALERARASTQPYPERKHVAHFLGWCTYHLGDLEAARAAFTEHLRAVPDEPDSTFGLGLVELGEDKLDAAQACFERALKGFSEPKPRANDQARVLTRMADLALRRDDVAGAEALLERAVRASPVQHETWSKLARVKDRLGKPSEADAARANAQRVLDALGRKEPATPPTPSSEAAPQRPPAQEKP